ncbi:MAG TPA: hypothetical protein VKE94_13505, partial [Gemmataceae bacterium]|nr:hypothetical protein [Gemmataceae bacterium]
VRSSFASPLSPREGFELLASERIRRHHKDAIAYFIGDINYPQKTPFYRLTKGLAGTARTSFVLTWVRHYPFCLGFGNAMIVYMGQAGLGITVVTDFHTRLLRGALVDYHVHESGLADTTEALAWH